MNPSSPAANDLKHVHALVDEQRKMMVPTDAENVRVSVVSLVQSMFWRTNAGQDVVADIPYLNTIVRKALIFMDPTSEKELDDAVIKFATVIGRFAAVVGHKDALAKLDALEQAVKPHSAPALLRASSLSPLASFAPPLATSLSPLASFASPALVAAPPADPDVLAEIAALERAAAEQEDRDLALAIELSRSVQAQENKNFETAINHSYVGWW